MDATIKLNIDPRDAVPAEGRVEWLERFGPLKYYISPRGQAEVALTATLAQWHEAGAHVEPDGAVAIYNSSLHDALTKACLRFITEAGQVPAELPRAIVESELLSYAVAKAEAQAAEEEAGHQKKAQEERLRGEWLALPADLFDPAVAHIRGEPYSSDTLPCGEGTPAPVRLGEGPLLQRAQASRLAAKMHAARAEAAAIAERDTWIREHGSERLRSALALGLVGTVTRSYQEERLAAERVGWRFASEYVDEDVEGSIIEPTEKALAAFAVERTTDPKTELVWLVTEHGRDCEDGHCDAACEHKKGPALATDFLGRRIVKELSE